MIDYFRRKKREREDARIRAELIPTLHGKAIKYVSERGEDGLDTVLGKEGSISLRDGQIIVLSSSEIVFRCGTDSLSASVLMSGDGVILEGPDIEHGGKNRKIIAYYLYYR